MFGKILNHVIFAIFFTTVTSVAKDTNTVKMNPITVTASRVPALYSETARVVTIIDQQQIENAAVQSISDLLEFSSGIDVRQRGSLGVQSDISIRGGSADQTMILLNGINVTDSQTGHHNMNIPVDLESISRIEILQGSGSRVFGPNAFSGAINIITKASKTNQLAINASGGEYGYVNTGFNGTINTSFSSTFLSVSNQKSDGFIDNTDFKTLNIYTKHEQSLFDSKFVVQAGHNDKQFGANSFYTPKYPNQFEHTRSSFASLQMETGNKLKFTPSVYYRRHQDRFELFRSNPADWYTSHNYHVTNTYGAQANLSYTSYIGITNIGLDYRLEKLLSNKLGYSISEPKEVPFEENAFFDKEYQRNLTTIFIEHNAYINDFTLSGGLALNYSDDYGTNYTGGIDLAYKINDNTNLFTSVNNTLRLPTYTDLFYTSPTNIGNPELLPEKAYSFETGMKHRNAFMRSTVSGFLRLGKDLIDWIKNNPADDKWTTKNLTELTTVGFDVLSYVYLEKLLGTSSPFNYINISYTFISNSKSSDEYISYYVMDNLRHKLTFAINHDIYAGLKADWKFSYQDRNGTYTSFNSTTMQSGVEKPYNDMFILDAKLYYNFESFTIFAEASNILDNQVADVPNVAVPGRWIRLGLKTNLEF